MVGRDDIRGVHTGGPMPTHMHRAVGGLGERGAAGRGGVVLRGGEQLFVARAWGGGELSLIVLQFICSLNEFI